MELKVGATYLTKHNKPVKIISGYAIGKIYKGIVNKEIHHFNKNGLDLEEPEFDLIEEITNANPGQTTNKTVL